MTKENNMKQALIFCEDCGERNFYHYREEKDKIVKKKIQFRCKACNYLNTCTL
jgi:DNA-directed RNA polymerase subunit RPC12/RpoP